MIATVLIALATFFCGVVVGMAVMALARAAAIEPIEPDARR